MPKPRKPYMQKEVTRHGKIVWYFRKGKEQRIRLPGAFGSPEFNRAYNAALAGMPIDTATPARHMTIRWLVAEYYMSGRYTALSQGTQNNHRRVLDKICETAGDLNALAVTKQQIQAGIVRREDNQYAAKAYLTCMSILLKFAVEKGILEQNPAEGLSVSLPKSDGFHTWSQEEIAKFRAAHPLGTAPRVALDIMLYTGLRISDAIKFSPDHIKNDTFAIKSQKTGVETIAPVLPPLAESLAAMNITSGPYIRMQNGRPLTHGYSSQWFADMCRELKIKGRAHGLRKAGATMAAENGATPYELSALFGWGSTKMAEIYTRKADRARLAGKAARKLYPHHEKGAGNEEDKDKT